MRKKFSYALMVALVAMFALGAGNVNAQVSVGQIQLAPGGIGDTLLGGYYDVRDIPSERDTETWQNFFVVQNTSNAWIAFHLRFRAYASSIEVWDHIILLSPYDVFWGYLIRPATGGVIIGSYDTETLKNSGLPVDAQGNWQDNFKNDLLVACGFPTGTANSELEAGEMEVIGLWKLPATQKTVLGALTATYGNDAIDLLKGFDFFTGDGAGKYNVYDILAKEWGTGNRPDTYGGTKPAPSNSGYLVDCPNVLTGSMEIGDTITGQYYSYNLVALQDFRTDLPDLVSTDGRGYFHRDQFDGGVILYPVSIAFATGPFNDNQCFGVTEEIAWYLNPDWATTHGPTLRDGNNWSAIDGMALVESSFGFRLSDFNRSYSLDEVEAALRVGDVWAFYYKDFLGSVYTTDAIVSFPTKYLHFFFTFDRDTLYPGEWPYWQDGFFTCGDYWVKINLLRKTLYGLWIDPDGPVRQGQVILDGRVWNTEQKESSFFFVSPHIYSPTELLNEVNIVRFGKDDGQGTAYVQVDPTFTAGQFTLFGWTLPTGQRFGDGYPGALPMIGGTVRLHNTGNSVKYRSTMVPWVYTPAYDLIIN